MVPLQAGTVAPGESPGHFLLQGMLYLLQPMNLLLRLMARFMIQKVELELMIVWHLLTRHQTLLQEERLLQKSVELLVR